MKQITIHIPDNKFPFFFGAYQNPEVHQNG